MNLNKREGFRAADRRLWPTCQPTANLHNGKHYRLLRLNKDTLIWEALDSENSGQVLKLYYNRGPISWLREHLFAFRVEREYRALRFLEQRGLPCSRPLFWTRGNAPELGGRWEALATRIIPNALPLQQWLKENDALEAPAPLSRTFRLVRDMHEAGMHHGALYTRNILLSGDELAPHIIDLPRAEVFPTDIIGTTAAWFDLLNLCHQLLPYLKDEAIGNLLEVDYGLSSRDRACLLRRLAHYHPNKHSRNRQRAQISWRRLLSGLGMMPPRRAP